MQFLINRSVLGESGLTVSAWLILRSVYVGGIYLFSLQKSANMESAQRRLNFHVQFATGPDLNPYRRIGESDPNRTQKHNKYNKYLQIYIRTLNTNSSYIILRYFTHHIEN